MQSIQARDAKRRCMRIGDVVRRTIVIDHANGMYTISLRGIVVDIRSPRTIVITTTAEHRWNVGPWAAVDWTIIGHEALS